MQHQPSHNSRPLLLVLIITGCAQVRVEGSSEGGGVPIADDTEAGSTLPHPTTGAGGFNGNPGDRSNTGGSGGNGPGAIELECGHVFYGCSEAVDTIQHGMHVSADDVCPSDAKEAFIALETCVCGSCASACPYACGRAGTENECVPCVLNNCNKEYFACSNQ